MQIKNTSESENLWHHQAFLMLWLAQAVSNSGTAITRVALPLTAVLVLGATPAQMGLLSMADSLPNLLFGLVAGVWVDRLRRRPLLIGADLGRALLLGSLPVAAWFGVLSFAQVWMVAFLAGTLTVFFQIASIALLPALVAKGQIVEANSKFSLSDSVIAIAGPNVAGALVQLLSAPSAILVDALSYLLSAVALGGVGAAEPAPVRRESHLWAEIGEGMRELIGTPLLKTLTHSGLKPATRRTIPYCNSICAWGFNRLRLGSVLRNGWTIINSRSEGLLLKLVDDDLFIGELRYQFQRSTHCGNDPLQCTNVHIRLVFHLGDSRLLQI